MPDYTTENMRNVVAVGHGGVGKTTLLEQVLFKAGKTTRAGSVDDNTSIFDHDDEEKRRKLTINFLVGVLRLERQGVESS